MEVDSSIVPVSSTEDYTDYQASEPASGMRSLSLGPYLSLPLSRLSGQSDPVTFSPLPSFHFEDFTAGFSNDDSLPAQFCFQSSEELPPSTPQGKPSLPFPMEELPSLYSPHDDPFLSAFPSSSKEKEPSFSSLLPRGVIRNQPSELLPKDQTIEELDKQYPLEPVLHLLDPCDSSQPFSSTNSVCTTGSNGSNGSLRSVHSVESMDSLDSASLADDAALYEEHTTKRKGSRNRKKWQCRNCHYYNSISRRWVES